ncbi:S-layer homology domain-containing protein [Paenibacillus sp. GP183]|uniref:S-layer homology domain-containing protein n=1 Tax=Paenibacillus sp. GP183 TaxID=1882751 RepID=UPI000899EA45|nr:S-layer homology domain-containing protein [Paenibacillus sp. GP183]SEC46099.1 Cytochrome c553 [Paenibacillus sp. GP183]
MIKYRRLSTIAVLALFIAFIGMIGLGFSDDHKITAEALSAVQTAPPADAGKTVYQQYCLSCHAVDGHGNNGAFPDLVSDHFRKKLGTFEKAYNFISQKMPENAPGSLNDDQYKAVVKYILSLNGIPTDFADIDAYWAQKEINYLLGERFIDGYVSNGQLYYKPNQSITRAEFIRYLVKSKQLFLSNSSTTDLTDIDKSKDKVYILTAVEYGMIDGYPDHTFHPQSSITRAEIAAILARSEGLTPQPVSSFSDVSQSHWANSLIGSVVQAKLFNGYDDGTFKPGSAITRGEAAAVLYRLIHPTT